MTEPKRSKVMEAIVWMLVVVGLIVFLVTSAFLIGLALDYLNHELHLAARNEKLQKGHL